MALAALVSKEDHAKLPEGIRGEYAEKDGKFVLQVTAVDGYALEDVSGLKTALGRERDTKASLEKSMKAFEGMDAAAAKAALAKVGEMANWTPEGKVKEQIEALKAQLVEKHLKELGEKDGLLKTRTSQLHEVLVTSAATEAIAKAGGNLKLLLPHVERQIKADEVNGKMVAIVVDENGTTRISPKAGTTSPMTIMELVETMKLSQDYAVAFPGSGASGTGGKGAAGPAPQAGIVKWGDQNALNSSIEDIASGKTRVVVN